MISQHWFRLWLGAVRQQAITWAHVDPDLCRQMASLGLNELNKDGYLGSHVGWLDTVNQEDYPLHDLGGHVGWLAVQNGCHVLDLLPTIFYNSQHICPTYHRKFHRGYLWQAKDQKIQFKWFDLFAPWIFEMYNEKLKSFQILIPKKAIYIFFPFAYTEKYACPKYFNNMWFMKNAIISISILCISLN